MTQHERAAMDRSWVRFKHRVDAPIFCGCWQWLGQLSADGYGRIMHNGKRLLAHRYSYEMMINAIPRGLQLDHLCRNRGCVNPLHLEPVTAAENNYRGISFTSVNARKTHCSRRHLYDELSTRITPRGRKCRMCERINGRVGNLKRAPLRAQRAMMARMK